MAKIEGQGPLSSTKQTPWILKVCTHCSDDFCPNVTEIRPVSPIYQFIDVRKGQIWPDPVFCNCKSDPSLGLSLCIQLY